MSVFQDLKLKNMNDFAKITWNASMVSFLKLHRNFTPDNLGSFAMKRDMEVLPVAPDFLEVAESVDPLDAEGVRFSSDLVLPAVCMFDSSPDASKRVSIFKSILYLQFGLNSESATHGQRRCCQPRQGRSADDVIFDLFK